ncbi:MAG TPA: hypothetical protein ENI33_01560 [Thermoplasmatales archaeon]|nr:hypothetical protein [Thermoplasmatales archaeon]
MKKLVAFAVVFTMAFMTMAQPNINSVNDAPDPVEVPGYNNITADITNASQAYAIIYYPNSTMKGNFSMSYISPSTWYYNGSYSYPDPLGNYTYVIKAYNATGWSASALYNFTLQDTTPPSSSVNTLPQYWYNSNATVTATASDNYGLESVRLLYRYSADNSSWGSWNLFSFDYSSPWQWDFNFTAGEGYYRLGTRAKDLAGNTETLTGYTETCAYDATPPYSNLTQIQYWHSTTPITINASASDNLSGLLAVNLYYRYSSNNYSWGSWIPYGGDNSPPWQWNFTAPNGEGYYELYTISRDVAENSENPPPSADLKIGVDLNPPITTISASQSYGNYILPTSMIILSATDTVSGVNSIYYRIWNGTWHPIPGTGVGKGNNFYVYSAPFYLTKEGTNYVEFYSDDIVGNEETTHNVTYIVDTVPPSITNIVAFPSVQLPGNYVNVSCDVTDNKSGVKRVFLEVEYPDGSFSNFTMYQYGCCGYYRNRIYNIVGEYNFTIYAVDNLGNGRKSSVHHFTIQGGNSPPTTTYSLNPSSPNGKNGWYITSVEVTFTATDPDGDAIAYTKYRIDGGAWITYTGSFFIDQDGEHTIEFYSEDDKGNVETTKNFDIKIDTSAPTVLLQKPVFGYLYIFDRAIWPLASGNTVVIGKITVRVIAYDGDSRIDNVSFYVNGLLENIDTLYPYEWLWRGDIGYRYLQVVGYNNAGLKDETIPILIYIFSI